MHFIVESIEDGVAMLESGDDYLELPAACLPEQAEEGTLLRLDIRRGGDFAELRFTLENDTIDEREPEPYQLGHSMPRRNPPGMPREEV